MSPMGVVVWFTLEVGIAAGQLGVPVPPVLTIYQADFPSRVLPRTVAYVDAGNVVYVVEDWAVYMAVLHPEEVPERTRCYARHEVAHLYLGHADGFDTMEQYEVGEKHAQELTRKVWGEDLKCGAH